MRGDPTEEVEFGLLGPLSVRVAGRPMPVRSAKYRILLAALLLEPGQLVPVERLVEAIWGDRQPDNPRRAVQICVTRIRALFAEAGLPAIITTGTNGYLIEIAPEVVDLGRFERLLREADRAAQRADPEAEAAALRRALGQWRGEALADVPSELLQWEYVPRLREQRLRTLERRIETDLRLGRHRGLVDELTELTVRHPLRERLWLHLVTALHADGRRTEALNAYHEARRQLAKELGLDPGDDLRQLHAQVLAGAPAGAAGAAPAAPVPRQLPVEGPGFAGRVAEIVRLHRALEAHEAAAGSRTTIVVITGTAGVGKTALALHWSRRAADRFPDGQLWVNLRGFDRRTAVTPQQALARLLGALGIGQAELPSDLDGQMDLYRSVMDGRRMLVVLDNARDAEHVRPLLPGGTGSFVIATSRTELGGLVAVEAAHALRLDPFTTHEARQMFQFRVGRQRVGAEPDAVDRITDKCGGLPLALAIVAARAVARPTFPLGALDQQLGSGRLDRFSSPAAAVDVRDVFSWSYDSLSPAAARLFRRLGLHPTAELSAEAAAGLDGTAGAEAQRSLDELADAHLVTEHMPNRYALHDLLHRYAAELADRHDPVERRAVDQRRWLRWLTATALNARPLLQPSESDVTVPARTGDLVPLTFAGERDAREWYEVERHNLVAAVQLADAAGFDDLCWRLAYATWIHLHLVAGWDDLFRTHEAGLRAAERCGDRIGQANMLTDLGVAYRSIRQPARAVETHRKALAIFEAADHQTGVSTVLGNLGAAYRDAGEYDRALDCSRRGYALERARDEPGNMAISLYQIASTLTAAGRAAEAIPVVAESLGLFRKISHRRGEARGLHVAATAHAQLGQLDEAIGLYRDAIAIYEVLGDRRYEAAAHALLGDAFQRAGLAGEGRRAWENAASLYEQIRAPEAGEVRARLDGARRT